SGEKREQALAPDRACRADRRSTKLFTHVFTRQSPLPLLGRILVRLIGGRSWPRIGLVGRRGSKDAHLRLELFIVRVADNFFDVNGTLREIELVIGKCVRRKPELA